MHDGAVADAKTAVLAVIAGALDQALRVIHGTSSLSCARLASSKRNTGRAVVTI
jgi:hypothetical protein